MRETSSEASPFPSNRKWMYSPKSAMPRALSLRRRRPSSMERLAGGMRIPVSSSTRRESLENSLSPSVGRGERQVTRSRSGVAFGIPFRLRHADQLGDVEDEGDGPIPQDGGAGDLRHPSVDFPQVLHHRLLLAHHVVHREP